MMVKLTQDLARGLKPWKDMFHENEATLNALGAKLVFAGTEKEDDSKLTAIIDFESPRNHLPPNHYAVGGFLKTIQSQE